MVPLRPQATWVCWTRGWRCSGYKTTSISLVETPNRLVFLSLFLFSTNHFYAKHKCEVILILISLFALHLSHRWLSLVKVPVVLRSVSTSCLQTAGLPSPGPSCRVESPTVPGLQSAPLRPADGPHCLANWLAATEAMTPSWLTVCAVKLRRSSSTRSGR